MQKKQHLRSRSEDGEIHLMRTLTARAIDHTASEALMASSRVLSRL